MVTVLVWKPKVRSVGGAFVPLPLLSRSRRASNGCAERVAPFSAGPKTGLLSPYRSAARAAEATAESGGGTTVNPGAAAAVAAL